MKSSFSREEITAGAEMLMQKIKMYKPKIVAFNGRGLHREMIYRVNYIWIILGIYEVYAGNKHFHYGKQPELFLGTDTVRISDEQYQQQSIFLLLARLCHAIVQCSLFSITPCRR